MKEASIGKSINQIPTISEVKNSITPVKDIKNIVELYPNQLRTLHTVFRLEMDGELYPIFLHSQVAFALI
jgi:hypothetical protein